MKKSTKMIAVLSLTFASTVALVVAGIPSNSFAFADREPYSTEFISNLAKELDTTPNEKPEIKRFISSNGIEFAFETYRCSKDSNNIKIQKGGYIRNITAINGLSKINNFVCNNSSIASFVECEADSDESSFSPTDAFSGDSTCKNHQFSGTNFILKSDGDLTVSSLEVCYSCTAGSNGFITSDAVDNMYYFDNVCEYYGYNADGTQAKPYKISGEEAFVAFAREVNSGNSYTGKYFKLDSDLDFTKEDAPEYVFVGDTNDNSFDGYFTGINGNKNYSITLNTTFPGEGGIFGGISENAIVENIDVKGTIRYEDGSGNIGGIVGYANGGKIRNCNVSCKFEAHDEDDPYGVSCLGGILGKGENGAEIISCNVNSDIVLYAGSLIGGLVGMYDDSCLLKDSNYKGKLFVFQENEAITEVGGLIGSYSGNYPNTKIQNCSITCSNMSDFSKRFDMWTEYDGMLLGKKQDFYEDELQAYIGAEVGNAFNSDYLEVLLDPGEWNKDNAWYAVYGYASGNVQDWYIMEKDLASGYYVAKVDVDNYDGIIFVRMSDLYSEPSWDGKWNQTSDIKEYDFHQNKNLFKITGWNNIDWFGDSFIRN